MKFDHLYRNWIVTNSILYVDLLNFSGRLIDDWFKYRRENKGKQPIVKFQQAFNNIHILNSL